MKITRVRKKFDYKGIPLQIVEREEPYMSAKVTMTRVIAPNGGTIPIKINYKETLKSIVQKTIDFLTDREKEGFDIINELTKEIEV